MAKRAVFEATDSQLERMSALDLQEKRLGSYAADAFEEWLKRRESRAMRAAVQRKRYAEMLGELDG